MMKQKKGPNPLYTSILLLLIAIASVTAATMAWLSIADSTKVKSMSMDVTSGVSLRFDLDPHASFADYVRTLNFTQIASRIASEKGFSMVELPLEPVTTSNYSLFTFENGSTADPQSGVYLEFALNFMATKDLVVHLTSSAGEEGQAGTQVSSSLQTLPSAMRISFTADGVTSVYDPGMGATSSRMGSTKVFGLPKASVMSYNEDNALFTLRENENKEVIVHIWMEGTDEACTDELQKGDYSITLRFEGIQPEE